MKRIFIFILLLLCSLLAYLLMNYKFALENSKIKCEKITTKETTELKLEDTLVYILKEERGIEEILYNLVNLEYVSLPPNVKNGKNVYLIINNGKKD